MPVSIAGCVSEDENHDVNEERQTNEPLTTTVELTCVKCLSFLALSHAPFYDDKKHDKDEVRKEYRKHKKYSSLPITLISQRSFINNDCSKQCFLLISPSKNSLNVHFLFATYTLYLH